MSGCDGRRARPLRRVPRPWGRSGRGSRYGPAAGRPGSGRARRPRRTSEHGWVRRVPRRSGRGGCDGRRVCGCPRRSATWMPWMSGCDGRCARPLRRVPRPWGRFGAGAGTDPPRGVRVRADATTVAGRPGSAAAVVARAGPRGPVGSGASEACPFCP
ncbi:hypothetical protein STPH1_6353 [Streptomyces sp. OM5714]|nr:hypothetical protein STPH1_6353 [Streptomyces sp. OM5714]